MNHEPWTMNHEAWSMKLLRALSVAPLSSPPLTSPSLALPPTQLKSEDKNTCFLFLFSHFRSQERISICFQRDFLFRLQLFFFLSPPLFQIDSFSFVWLPQKYPHSPTLLSNGLSLICMLFCSLFCMRHDSTPCYASPSVHQVGPLLLFGVYELFGLTAPAQMPLWPSLSLLLSTRTQ